MAMHGASYLFHGFFWGAVHTGCSPYENVEELLPITICAPSRMYVCISLPGCHDKVPQTEGVGGGGGSLTTETYCVTVLAAGSHKIKVPVG